MDEKIKRIELGFVNSYLLKARDGYVLIDTGLPFQWEILDKQLVEAGCAPGNLKLVVITHGDWDHTGSVARVREKYGAKIAMGEADAINVETGVQPKRKIRKCRARLRMFMLRIIRRFQRRKMNFPAFKSDIILTDGQSLEPWGVDAKVYHLPGHTKGSVSVLTKDGGFFCGDTFTNTEKPESAVYIENLDELKSSIEKIKKLDIKTVYPGHGKPFDISLFPGTTNE